MRNRPYPSAQQRTVQQRGNPARGEGTKRGPRAAARGEGPDLTNTTYPSMVPGHAKKNALNCELNCELSCSQPKSLLGL